MKREKVIVRYAILVLVLVVLAIILKSCHSSRSREEDQVPQTEAATAETFAFDTESQNDTDPVLKTLFARYYGALVQGNTETMMELAYPMSEAEVSYIGVLSSFYEDVDDISYYSKAGLTEGSYLVSVTANVKFVDVDTAVPNLDFFYVETDEQGNLYINNTYSMFNMSFGEEPMDPEVSELIRRYFQQSDFLMLQTRVNEG